MQDAALERARERLRVDDQSAVMRTDDPLRPHTAGATIHFDVDDLGHHRLAAERVRDAASAEDLAAAARLRVRSRLPPVFLGGRLENRDRSGALEAAVV